MTVHCNRPLTVDAVIIYDGKILFVRRGHEPFKGRLALPGGFVEANETVEEAITREVREETGLETKIIQLLGVYSDPNRDPRGPMVSICYLLRAAGGTLSAASDAVGIELISPDQVPELAFDHNKMVADALGVGALEG
ncbi:MAG TPA: NUDIX hydrolase [Methanocella sp.]|nr:NUDIX hydrolase [Methanocella sp.]